MNKATADRDLVTRNLALVADIESDREAARRLNVAARTLKEWRAGEVSPLRSPTRKKLISNLRNGPERQDAPDARPLDEAIATNARVMERLAGLLERDQIIFELRARADLLRLQLQAQAASVTADAATRSDALYAATAVEELERDAPPTAPGSAKPKSKKDARRPRTEKRRNGESPG